MSNHPLPPYPLYNTKRGKQNTHAPFKLIDGKRMFPLITSSGKKATNTGINVKPKVKNPAMPDKDFQKPSKKRPWGGGDWYF